MIIIGGDTETHNGEPFCFQFYSEDLPIEYIIFTDSKKAFRDFISFCDTLPSVGTSYSIYFHNLTFDMVSLFHGRREILLEEKGEFTYGKWKIRFLYGSTAYFSLTHKNKRKSIMVVDSARFLMGKLSTLADIFTPDIPKLDPPAGLGTKKFTIQNKKFIKYAMQDAKIVYHLGKIIDRTHINHDVKQAVSIAQLAARIFRHGYMKADIPLPMRKIIYAALHSYHGGKNYFNGEARLHKGIYFIDIISAYPYAMSRLPSFSKPDLYQGWKSFDNTFVPEFGIYKVKAKLKKCKWPVLFSHGFKGAHGDVELWTTGPELNEAIRSKEIEIKYVFGYFYDSEKDETPSPFKTFVDYFFREKDIAADPVTRHFNKTILNSLYGKFIQKNYVKNCYEFIFDIDTNKIMEVQPDFEAGGLFHPFIASLITGHTRAYIHRLEHKYKSIHTSTDGIVSRIKPRETNTLGGLKIEFEGDILILRNKLYICYNPQKSDRKSILFKGRYIHKFALHAFRSDVHTLEKLVKDNVREYKYIKVNKLRESQKRGLAVNKFEERISKLNIGEVALD